MLKRTSNVGGKTAYEVNICARLAESYWVKLTDPIECTVDMREADSLDASSVESWLAFVDRVRDGDRQRHAVVGTGLLI